jgi:hypothetical protein
MIRYLVNDTSLVESFEPCTMLNTHVKTRCKKLYYTKHVVLEGKLLKSKLQGKL